MELGHTETIGNDVHHAFSGDDYARPSGERECNGRSAIRFWGGPDRRCLLDRRTEQQQLGDRWFPLIQWHGVGYNEPAAGWNLQCHSALRRWWHVRVEQLWLQRRPTNPTDWWIP